MIAGALDGLNHYLTNFSTSESEDKKSAKSIFDYAKKALLGDTDDINRYAMPRGEYIYIYFILKSFRILKWFLEFISSCP